MPASDDSREYRALFFDVRAAKQLKPGEHLVVEGCEGLRLVASASKMTWTYRYLGNILPDDGWTYRGRSPGQITGRDNYARVGDLIGQNLVGIPDLLSQPRFALDAFIAWWEDRIPDSMLSETTAIRKRVNGGIIGLAEVQALTTEARAALEA